MGGLGGEKDRGEERVSALYQSSRSGEVGSRRRGWQFLVVYSEDYGIISWRIIHIMYKNSCILVLLRTAQPFDNHADHNESRSHIHPNCASDAIKSTKMCLF